MASAEVVHQKSRPLKFRLWNREKKKWATSLNIKFEANNDTIHKLSSADLDICQFTGLHDKNGKEIYEGDLLKNWGYGLHEGLYEVQIPQIFYDSAEGADGIEDTEVIGNRFEYPELLTQET